MLNPDVKAVAAADELASLQKQYDDLQLKSTAKALSDQISGRVGKETPGLTSPFLALVSF